MKKKILKNMSIVVVLSMILTFALMLFLLYRESHQHMETVVKTEAGYVKLAVEEVGEDFLDDQAADVSPSRLTLIDEDGNVLYDSAQNPREMENHKTRPEVKAALSKGSGKDTRLSATLGEETFYYALRLKNGKIIRIARTTTSVFFTVKDCIVPLSLIFIAVLVVAAVLTKHQTDNLVAPLNALDLENPLENEVYEEISPLLTRISQQNYQLDRQMDVLQEKQREYETITDNMKDGLVVTDRSVILSINKKAQEVFHMKKEECIHKNILALGRNLDLKQCLELALKGQSNDRTVELEGKNYQLIGNPVCVDKEIRGAVIFLLDVTEKEQSERMRREFTANVSHELKTPLMSISGYAELIMNNMVKPENITEFASRIYHEANRLSNLVSDIIKLSKLDEKQGGKMEIEEDVNLWTLSSEAVWQLQHKASQRNIKVKMEGQPVKITGNRQILNEMIYNILENAIKYNVDDGTVTLSIREAPGEVTFMVEDTGIGIPAAERERIFERFYRVDKSRSREIEGTGLGLSIVKHAVSLHHGKVEVESVIGQGTRMIVTLPQVKKPVLPS